MEWEGGSSKNLDHRTRIQDRKGRRIVSPGLSIRENVGGSDVIINA